MPMSQFKFRLSFQTKVLVPVVAFLVLLPAITLWIVNGHITRQVHDEARKTLLTAEAVFRDSLNIHGTHLLSRYRTVANEPRLKAASRATDKATMADQLAHLLGEMGGDADLLLFSTDTGELLASARRDLSLSDDDFAQRGALTIKRALEGNAAVEIVSVRDHLYHVVSAPVSLGGAGPLAGAFTVAVNVGDATTQQLQRQTRTQIVLVSDQRVVASTFPSLELYSQVVELFQRLARQNVSPSPAVAPLIKDTIMNSEHFLALAGRLASATDGHRLGYLLLSSYEPQLREVQATQRTLLIVSLLCILPSTAIVWWLVRRNTQPLHQLRDNAEAVGRGDFSRRIEVTASDECGELAQAFNQMTQNLQTSRAQRCHKIVQSLLSFARQHPPERSAVNVNDVIGSVLEILAYELRTSNVQVVQELDAQMPHILADPHQLQQVFLNILNNGRQALQARPQGGCIRAATTVASEHVRVVFEDNGPGIPPEIVRRIFDPFFTTKPLGQATGLGLSLAYGIIKEHGGTIHAQSVLGQGASLRARRERFASW